MKVKDRKTVMRTMRMSEEENARWKKLAEHYNLGLTSLFRFLLKAEERRLAK